MNFTFYSNISPWDYFNKWVLLFICLDICSKCESNGFTIEVGCDYPGNDIWAGFGKTSSFEECVEKCKTVSNCKVAMWNSADGNCYPKSDISPKKCNNPQNTAGRKCSSVMKCSKFT